MSRSTTLRNPAASITFVFLVGIRLLTATPVLAQQGALSGKVIDGSNQQPVPFASVFFANSLIGTRTLEDGSYRLDKIPVGKYDLTISSVGYLLATVPVEIKDPEKRLTISIRPETKTLATVTVSSKNADYLRNLKRFKQYFLGETLNASKCRIINLDDITISYDNDSKILTASSDKPIIIENRALGYRVLYLLKEFKIDDQARYFTISGIPRFEVLKQEKKSDPRRWKRERNRAYFGSMTHFMRSLKFSCLADDGFLVFNLTLFSKRDSTFHPEWETVNDTLYTSAPIRESELLHRKFDGHGLIKIIYTGENQEVSYSKERGASLLPQTSWLRFRKRGLRIYDNGYFEDELNYISSGYFGWSNGVAEMIPLEYQPTSNESDDIQDAGISSDSTGSRGVSGLSSFSGIITEEDGHQPIAAASVFLANSNYRCTSSTEGAYKLDSLPAGKFDLIVTAPGHEMIDVPLVINGHDEKVSWVLKKIPVKEPNTETLPPRVIRIIKTYFNGVTENSVKCELLNLKDLHVDEADDMIVAVAENPIIVENHALGYRVTCWLDRFTFDQNISAYLTDGVCALEELKATSPSDEKRWQSARASTWNRSFANFMKSMKERSLKKNHFEIYRMDGAVSVPVDEAWFFSDRVDSPVELKVLYTGEAPAYSFTGQHKAGPQISWVTITKDSFKSFPNIYIKPLATYNLKGYFRYLNGIAELLPSNYNRGTK